MSVITWVRERFAARAAGRLVMPSPDSYVVHPWLRDAGVTITPEVALTVSAVYGCVRLIVDCIAPAPIVVTEVEPGGRRRTLADDPTGWILNYGPDVRYAPDAPTPQAVEEALLWSSLAMGDGNGYAEIQRDGSGKFFALWPLDPDRVTPRRDADGFYYEVMQAEGGRARVEPMDMFHLRGPSLRGWVGDSTIYRACRAIGIAHASSTFTAAYFANGTSVSGVLSSDKIVSKDQADRARAEWERLHAAGPAKSHSIAVTGQGLKYQPLNHSASEAALVDSRKFQISEIARFYGVPLTLLSESEAWTNLGAVWENFYRQTLRAVSARWDAEATRKLYPQRKPWREVSHDLTHLTLGNMSETVAAARAAVEGGLWTRNEARELWGKNSLPGGDRLTVTAATKTLDDALKPPAPPAPARPPGADEGEPEAPDESRPALVAAELAAHARRIKARRADLARKGLPAVTIADHATRLRAQASANMRALMPDTDPKLIASALDAAEAGVDPRTVVLRFGVTP